MKRTKTDSTIHAIAMRCCRLSAAAVLICASCSKQQPPAEPEGVVARIGEKIITVDDVQAEARRRQQAGRPVLSKEKLREEMLTEKALLLRAEQQFANDPGIRREMDRLLVLRLRDRELSEKLKAFEVAEAEIKEVYQQRIEKYTRPAYDRVAALFLRMERNVSDVKKERIQNRIEAARKQALEKPSSKGFGSLAVTCSDDQLSRYRGGDIGWIAQNKSTTRLPDSVLETARALETGVMSDVLETEDGLYLVMKTDFRPASTTPYEQVRGSLRQSLLTEGRRVIEQQYLMDCVAAANPLIDEKPLGELELSTEPPPEQTDQVPVLAAGLPPASK